MQELESKVCAHMQKLIKSMEDGMNNTSNTNNQYIYNTYIYRERERERDVFLTTNIHV